MKRGKLITRGGLLLTLVALVVMELVLPSFVRGVIDWQEQHQHQVQRAQAERVMQEIERAVDLYYK